MHSTTSLLRSVDFLTSLVVNGAILGWSFEAYRRTKLGAFAFWICSCTVWIIVNSAWFDAIGAPLVLASTPIKAGNEIHVAVHFRKSSNVFSSFLKYFFHPCLGIIA